MQCIKELRRDDEEQENGWKRAAHAEDKPFAGAALHPTV